MLKELKTTKDRVKDILIKSESSRNSDKALFASYIYKYHNELLDDKYKISLNDFYKLPSTESIRRSRQLIQRKAYQKINQGYGLFLKYLPTDPKVRNKRKMMENVFLRFTTGR